MGRGGGGIVSVRQCRWWGSPSDGRYVASVDLRRLYLALTAYYGGRRGRCAGISTRVVLGMQGR